MKMKFKLDDNQECNVIKTFSNNGVNYVIYTDSERDENNELVIHASRYIFDGTKMILNDIEEEKEWDLIDEEIKKLRSNI